MPQTLKFRAWDQVQNHFVYFELGVTDGKMWTTPPIYTNHVISQWQQFTALLDKNGNEIYGGDIVELGGSKYEVVYLPGAFYLKIKNGSTDMGIGKKNSKNCEIIGNIYKNHELLNQ